MYYLIVGVGRMVGCFELEMKFYGFLFEMELPPQSLINRIYRYKHETLYSKVMKQLKTYRLDTVFVVSLELLEHGYYEFGGVRTPCIKTYNIDATSYEILCLINRDYNNRWVSGFGRAVWIIYLNVEEAM